MRLLHFVSAYVPSTGGTVTRLRHLFSNDGNEHAFYALKSASGNAGTGAENAIGNIRVHRPMEVAALSRIDRLPWRRPVAAGRILANAAMGERPEILYGHNPLGCALASLSWHGRRPEVPFVYEAHGIMREFTNVPGLGVVSRPTGPIVRSVLGRYESRVMAAADRVVAQTEAARRKLIGYYGLGEERVATIFNGVDSGRFDPGLHEDDRIRIREELGVGERVVFLYAGYLDRVNGVDFLIEAVGGIPAELRRRVLFLLIGDGPRAGRAGEFARDHGDFVRYLGSRGFEEMAGYYAAADVFVIPRPASPPAETFLPMKLLEAMSMGKTVLVSDVAAMADVVRDGENGVLFRKGDQRSFLDRFVEIVSQPGVYGELGAAARRDVVERFTWEASRARLGRMLEEVISSR